MNKSNERLRHQLEVQSVQIEKFLNKHKVPAEVSGGAIRSSWVNFDLNTQITAGIEKLKHLGNELASTLGAADVSITHYDDRLRIAVKQPENHPVDLLDLIEALPDISPMTATLGIDEADRPVLLNLLADDMINILVAGGPEAGKTARLRTFALSLALQNRQSQIQMAILDVAGEQQSQNHRPSLYPLNYLPHVMFTVVESLREAAEALYFLVSEAEYRIEQEVKWPLLVLMIDDVDKLVEIGGMPIIEPLTFLLEEGVNAGMRVVLSASNPAANSIRPVLKNSMPVRLVGQVSDAAAARAISGIQDSQAEYLMGKGDFIAVSNGIVLPFQAAFLTEYDLHLILDKLHRQQQPVMVAQPLSVRPTLDSPDQDETDDPQYFEYNSQDRRAELHITSSPSDNGSSPKMIDVPHRPEQSEEEGNEIEEAVWEEIVEEEDTWQEEEEEEFDVWASYEDPTEDDENDNWVDNAEEESKPVVEVWSQPRRSGNGRKNDEDLNANEIEFDWK